jgi:hypothetical protein
MQWNCPNLSKHPPLTIKIESWIHARKMDRDSCLHPREPLTKPSWTTMRR